MEVPFKVFFACFSLGSLKEPEVFLLPESRGKGQVCIRGKWLIRHIMYAGTQFTRVKRGIDDGSSDNYYK